MVLYIFWIQFPLTPKQRGTEMRQVLLKFQKRLKASASGM